MRTKWLAGFVIGANLLSAADKEMPPPAGPPKSFVLPAHKTYSLSNGMRVTLAPWGTLPVVAVRVRVQWGNLNEAKDQVWLSDFAAALLKEGAAGMTGEQMANAAAKIGGQLNVTAGSEATTIAMNSLSEFAPNAIALTGNVIRKPDFPASEVERLRANLVRRVVVAKSDPDSAADEAFASATYGEHPYGRRLPTEEQLKSYKLEEIKRFYLANAGALRSHIYVAGQFDEKAVRNAIAAAFGSWEKGPAAISNPPVLKAEKKFVLVDRPGAQQSNLRLGIPISQNPASPDYVPMQLTEAMLGGLFNSRITANIREDKGYTYSPYSFIESHPGSAVWEESADVTTSATADSLKEIFKEVDRMRREAPPETELQGAKNALTGRFVLQNASAAGVINQLIFTDQYGLGDAWLNTYVQKLNAVNRTDIQAMAETSLKTDKMTVVVVGDKSKIEESLKSYQ